MAAEQITTYAFRLLPGQDLRQGIEEAVHRHQVGAGWILTVVGSLVEYKLRFADQSASTHRTGHFEIVGVTGTLSVHGCHMHISVSDEQGHVTGGHLLEGCKVYTTAEIVIGATDKYVFTRENDGSTPWKELQIT